TRRPPSRGRSTCRRPERRRRSRPAARRRPRRSRSCVPEDVQVPRCPELPPGEARWPVWVEPYPGQPLEQPRERDSHLHTGEVVARAVVRPEAERSVGSLRPEEVVLVGGRPPHLLVAVRRRDQEAEV